MLTKQQKEEVIGVVMTTLDFCGDVPLAVRQWCHDNSKAMTADVWAAIFDGYAQYKDEARRIREIARSR
jgi:hypothetical protein